MDFGEALKLLRKDVCVAREEWGSATGCLRLVLHDKAIAVWAPAYLLNQEWRPRPEDLLATDWTVVAHPNPNPNGPLYKGSSIHLFGKNAEFAIGVLEHLANKGTRKTKEVS